MVDEVEQQAQQWLAWEERYWTFVDKTEDCWQWKGEVSQSKGYGIFRLSKGTERKASLIAWEIDKGAVPPKMTLALTCGNESCINPGHYELRQRTVISKGRKRGPGFLPEQERFWRKTKPDGDCIVWTGATLNTGAGLFRTAKDSPFKTTTVQRLSYQFANGVLPSSVQIIQTCKNKLCVKLEHLAIRPKTEKKSRYQKVTERKPYPQRARQDLIAEFYRLVNKTDDDHWLWIGDKKSSKFPVWKHTGGSVRTFAFCIVGAKLKPENRKDFMTVPSCKKLWCLNPDHLINLPHKQAYLILSEAYFLNSFTVENDHWLWNKSLNPDGYGSFGANKLAHRFSYQLFNGPLSPYMFVCHTCDVRHCVNPAHLYLGNAQTNAQDTAKRKRVYQDPQAKNVFVTPEELNLIRRVLDKFVRYVSSRFSLPKQTTRKLFLSTLQQNLNQFNELKQ